MFALLFGAASQAIKSARNGSKGTVNSFGAGYNGAEYDDFIRRGVTGRATVNQFNPRLNMNLGFFGRVSPQDITVSRNKAFRDAKRATGIPKSAQFEKHGYVFDSLSENRMVYQYTVNGKKKYIVLHKNDKFGRGAHFHGADDAKGNPFVKGRYNQYDGHFPEYDDGFRIK